MRRFWFLITLLLAMPARGDYVEEHLDWFLYTQPPAEGHALASTATPSGRFLMRATGGTTKVLLSKLEPSSVTFVHAGGVELENQRQFLADEGFNPYDYAFFDATDLDTQRIGDFAGFPVERDGLVVWVDPRYDPGRPRDDAFASRFAHHLGTCAHRPPLRVLAGLLEVNQSHDCVISQRLYTLNPFLTRWQVDVMLHRYFGCETLVVLQPLDNEGEGRLDLFFRFTGQNQALLGAYESIQDDTSREILDTNEQTLYEALPELSVVRIPMPDPDFITHPSFLTYLNTGTRIIVPIFGENNEHQQDALDILGQQFPDHEIDTLDVTVPIQTGTHLTTYVAAFAPFAVDTECAEPEVLCDNYDWMSCDDLCFDECLEVSQGCVDGFNRWECEVQDDGCIGYKESLCSDNWICDEGVCKKPPGPCEDMPDGGRCNGDILETCAGDQLFTVDCAAQDAFCGYGDDDKPQCLPFCTDNCPEEGVTQCSEDDLAVEVCTPLEGCLLWKSEPCPTGETCEDGSCTPEVDGTPDADADVVSSTDTGSNPDISAGFEPSDGGCALSNFDSSMPPWLMLLLLLVLATLGRRSIQA